MLLSVDERKMLTQWPLENWIDFSDIIYFNYLYADHCRILLLRNSSCSKWWSGIRQICASMSWHVNYQPFYCLTPGRQIDTTHYYRCGLSLSQIIATHLTIGDMQLSFTGVRPSNDFQRLGHRNFSLHWRHNERDSVSNHRCLDCLSNRLFWRRSQKISKPCVTGFCEGNHHWPVDSPHKGPVLPSNAENVSISWRLACPNATEVPSFNTVKPVYNDHLMGYFSAFLELI